MCFNRIHTYCSSHVIGVLLTRIGSNRVQACLGSMQLKNIAIKERRRRRRRTKGETSFWVDAKKLKQSVVPQSLLPSVLPCVELVIYLTK